MKQTDSTLPVVCDRYLVGIEGRKRPLQVVSLARDAERTRVAKRSLKQRAELWIPHARRNATTNKNMPIAATFHAIERMRGTPRT